MNPIEFIAELVTYRLFWAPLASILIAGFIKSLIILYHEKKFSFKSFLSYGGMPSAHSAAVASITVAIFLEEGFSTVFFLSAVCAIITIRDAFGVRLESGKQAEAINKMADELQIPLDDHLKELLGHTKRQSFFGVLLGIFVTILIYLI